MNTFFAAEERATDFEIRICVDLMVQNPVIDGLMQSVSGLVAVLNEQRQVVSINSAAFDALGISDPAEVIGLRPGEIISCKHAHEAPNGCGTTPYCSSCGAAIAIVTALQRDQPEERICALTVERDHVQTDCCFKVQAIPIYLRNVHFVLLFMNDITKEHSREELESLFFHDISNTLGGLLGSSELLAEDHSALDLVDTIRSLSLRLCKDIELHRAIIQADDESYRPELEDIRVSSLIKELRSSIDSSRCAEGKSWDIHAVEQDLMINSDHSLLRRILINMLTNAFEATDEGGTVRMWMEQTEADQIFCVWNSRAIAADVQPRIFQRYFSTKSEGGHGMGTYSMKLFAEKLLGGSIRFESSPENGTQFSLALLRKS